MSNHVIKTMLNGEKIIKIAEFRELRFLFPILGFMICALLFECNKEVFIILTLFLIWPLYYFVKFCRLDLTLTNFRLVANNGGHKLDIRLDNIDSVELKSFDTLTIHGQGISFTITYVKDATSFYELLFDTIEERKLQRQTAAGINAVNSDAKYCRFCGGEIMPNSIFCSKCGKQLSITNHSVPQLTIQNIRSGRVRETIVVETERSNGMGTAGFIFAILGLIVSWAPVVNFVIWFLGFLFSFIGLFKAPRGMAITGFMLSIIGFILMIIIFGGIMAILSTFI